MDGYFPGNVGGAPSPLPDEPFCYSELINFDCCPELYSPSAPDLTFLSYAPSVAAQPYSGSSASYMPSASAVPVDEDAVDRGASESSSYDRTAGVEKALITRNGLQHGCLSDSPSADGSRVSRNVDSFCLGSILNKGVMGTSIPKSLDASFVISFPDKMLKALSFFKESSVSGVLAQVWIPIKFGDEYVLSTSDQPYLMDHSLAGYREISRSFTFSAREAPGYFPGLPGRVFISKMPEWTSNVIYYNKEEYLRGNYALSHKVRGSLAVPVFDPVDYSCCAVLELITTREKTNFDPEMETVCRALQAVNLRTVQPRVEPQNLTTSQRATFSEIVDVLRAVCHAHMLPLALTWVPFFHNGSTKGSMKTNNAQGIPGFSKGYVLNIQESACFVNDMHMQDFVRACAKHHLKEGQGIAGKALQSNHPFFCPDVKEYDMCEYPLAHHARKFGLHAAVAIRLRSTYTGDADYILELFLPLNCKGNTEQQRLLNNLSNTMQRTCRSLRTVSDPVHINDRTEAYNPKRAKHDLHPQDAAGNYPSWKRSNEDLNSIRESTHDENLESDNEDLMQYEPTASEIKGQQDKKRTTEKNITLSVLQTYFSGSLKDAAKSIGVCPTTLKRICRQYGISRWPSRKINKVNRSLKKIQTVIDSVQGVEGTLKYDPISGSLVAAVTSSDKQVASMLDTRASDASPARKSGEDNTLAFRKDGKCVSDVKLSKIDKADVFGDKNKFIDSGKGLSQQSITRDNTLWVPGSKDVPFCLSTSEEEARQLAAMNENPSLGSLNPGAVVVFDEIETANNGIVEQNHPSSSGMTDSSNGSESSPLPIMNPSDRDERGSIATVTVKATYEEDTVRFKFLPSIGCLKLYEEIGKRFKLLSGSFQLKYMDDEDEWVMLVNDADLQECIEIWEPVGSRSIKLLVRDQPFPLDSSSINFLSTDP